MFCKLFIEEGDYLDITTGEERNMMCAGEVHTPEGLNVGWDEFDSIEEAMLSYNLELKPEPEEDEEEINENNSII
jgi:hypothetical protein